MVQASNLHKVKRPHSMYKVSLLLTSIYEQYGWLLGMPCSTGVLGRCPNLQIISSGNYHQRLTWDAPATLNITAVEPDISSYIVCSNISTECTTINVTEAGGDSSDLRQYTFLNLRAYINFTVTAVNIVGVGESTSIVTEPCEHTGGSGTYHKHLRMG